MCARGAAARRLRSAAPAPTGVPRNLVAGRQCHASTAGSGCPHTAVLALVLSSTGSYDCPLYSDVRSRFPACLPGAAAWLGRRAAGSAAPEHSSSGWCLVTPIGGARRQWRSGGGLAGPGGKNGARSATEGLGAAEQANKQASKRSEQRQAMPGGGKLAGHTCRARGEELGRGA